MKNKISTDFDHVFYIHGFNSSLNSKSFVYLKNELLEPISGIEHTSRAIDSYNLISKYLKNVSDIKSTHSLFIGSSLGGFWANYFAAVYKQPAILINPSFKPSVTLSKYQGENVHGKIWTKDDTLEYTKFEDSKVANIPRLILIGKKDEVVDHSKTINTYKDIASIRILENEGHQILNHSILLKCIQEIDANSISWGIGD